MRALVTGGAGFIGSHLVHLLLERGWHVDVVDDLSTGLLTNIPQSVPNVKFHLRSAADPSLMMTLVRRVNVIFHLAAIVGVQRVLEFPVRTVEQNIAATANVLKWAAHYGIPAVIASSSEVYGRHANESLCEGDDIHISPHVRWGYAAAKAVDEFTALAHARETGLPVVICRLFNTIGTRQTGKYGMVVPRFIDQAKSGQPITVYGDGQQRRSFTWVGDVVRALFDLSQTQAAYGQIVNVGSDRSVSISELAKMIKSLCDSPSPIEKIDRRAAYGLEFDDIEDRLPSLTKIRALIDYGPSKTMDDTLREIVNARAVAARA